MVISIILFSDAHFGTAQSDTNVSGIITSDTTWTQANSPYTFTGPVAVNAGVTLTIQAGVTVNIGGYYLQVNGTLYARGSDSNRIYFNSNTNAVNNAVCVISFTSSSINWNEQIATGSIIENSVLTSIPINIENSSPKINDNIITFNSSNVYPKPTINVNGGSPVISNNIVTVKGSGFQCDGISVASGSPTISNNSIYGVNCFTGSGIIAGNTSISGNTLSGWVCGIFAKNNAVIERNLIYNNIPVSYAMQVGSGIEVQGNSVINNNTIINNPHGITVDSDLAKILNNNIYGNQYGIYLTVASSVNASYNWWGTTDTEAINQIIYDSKNNFNLGSVEFSPFLASPNTQTPTYINSASGNSGSIAPSGIIKVDYGGSQTFIITPNTGYQILDVKVNETSVGTVSSYTIQNIQGVTAISATFTPNPTPTPTPTASPTPSPSPTATPTQTPTSTTGPKSSPTTSPTSSPIPTEASNGLPITLPQTTPSPTLTVPEFPLWTIPLLLSLMMAAAGLLIYYKTQTKIV